MPQKKQAAKKAQKLLPQDTVGLVAPAFLFDPDLYERGKEAFEQEFKLKSLSLADASARHHYFAGDDKRRAAELIYWLTNPDAKGVIAIRGGYGLSRIYPTVIAALKKKRGLKPKVVLGYSDLTILLNGLYQDLGWVTFHGPTITGRPFREPLSLEIETLRTSLFSTEPLGKITHNKMRVMQPGKAEGVLVGGCLSLVTASLGTSYEIDTKGKVLFLEDVDERPFRIDRMLTQLIHAGKLDHVKAIVFGEMFHCEPYPKERDPEQTTAEGAIRLALGDFVKKKKIPVLLDFPAGHGSPQATFPIGVRVRVQTLGNTPCIEFLEAGVQERKK